jgi:hypothetical protein
MTERAKPAVDLAVPFPLTIGAIGGSVATTRVESLQNSVLNIAEKFSGQYPGDEIVPVRLRVLSSLLEGFDRLVVETLTARRGTDLKVVLPTVTHECPALKGKIGGQFADENMAARLISPEGAADFESLLAGTARPLALRKSALADQYEGELLAKAARRALIQAGRFVIDHSDLCIFLLGPKEQPDDLTNELYQYALAKKCPLRLIDSSDPSGWEEVQGDSLTEIMIKRLGEFNQAARKRDFGRRNLQRKMDALKNDYQVNLPGGLGPFLTDRLAPVAAVAATRSEDLKDQYMKAGLKIFLLSLGAALTVGVGVTFWHAPWPVFVIEAGFLVWLSQILITANRRELHNKWIEYRFLAERLRAAFFRIVCRVQAPPLHAFRRVAARPEAADKKRWQRGVDRVWRGLERVFGFRHGSAAESATAWPIVVSEHVFDFLPSLEPVGPDEIDELTRFIKQELLEDQKKWHLESVRKNLGRGERLEKWGLVTFILALFCAVGHFVLDLLVAGFHGTPGAMIVTLAALGLPALGAALGGIRALREYRHLADHSRMMAADLEMLGESFEIMTPEKLGHMALKVERLMIGETQGWLELMIPAELREA